MSVPDDGEFAAVIVKQSEKFLCGEIAKLTQAFKKTNEAFEHRIKKLEDENKGLKEKVSALTEKLDQHNSTGPHKACVGALERAFGAALTSVVLNPLIPLQDNSADEPLEAQQDPSTPMFVATSLVKRRKTQTEPNFTEQIITDIEFLPTRMREKIGPFYKESKCSTRDFMNKVQRAFLKYKVHELTHTQETVSDEYLSALIQEGIDEHIWTQDFKPSGEKSLLQYIQCRIKNEKKALHRQEMIESTNERLAAFLDSSMNE